MHRLWLLISALWLLLSVVLIQPCSASSPYSIMNSKKSKPKGKTTTTTTTRKMFYAEEDEEDDDDIDDIDEEEAFDDEQVFESHYTTSVPGPKKFTAATTSQNRVTPFISNENQPLNYCSFFNNRAPSPQINLKNCTWYKENSCCLQSEIESTFSKVKPLIGSSELCQQYINSLMCYICAPNQYKFYGKERLTVCRQFCNKMYEACADATLKGSKINEIYDNGEEFCKSRRYIVDDMEKDKCFYYKVIPRTNRAAAGSWHQRHFVLLTRFIVLFLMLMF